jgi:GNAT superfamily N-acetyltransferase
MDPTAVLALFDRQMRREVLPDGPGTRVERDGDTIRQVGAEHDWNGVLWHDLDPAGADAAIAAQVAYFAGLGLEFEWKVYDHDRPADFGDRLRAAGFTAGEPETLMIAPIAELPTEVVLPPGVEVRAVTDPAGVDLIAEVHEQAFGTGSARLRQRMLDQLALRPDEVRLTVAMAGDRPISAARMELCPGTDFAGLWGGGTVADWRGRGVYRALVAERARVAGGLGYRFLQVDASDQSRPILQRLGFVPLDVTTPYVLAAG